jgi:nanoRNase/pAp phosphatase (c-di-AMP/oligoRNAs hydrolase)
MTKQVPPIAHPDSELGIVDDIEQVRAPLLESIKKADLTKVAIFSGGGVDPDGLASQATMSAILTSFGAKDINCFYRGTFNRPQNKAFRKTLDTTPRAESEFKVSEGYTCLISVDGPASVCPAQPDFIIDHHEPSGLSKVGRGITTETDFRLIGSCSSIMWEYATEAGIDFSDEAGQKLATALALGIKTDTVDCSSDATSLLDYEAQAFCLLHKDTALYKDILNCLIPSYYHDYFVAAWNNKTIEGAVLVTGIGVIPVSRSGVISDIAEKLVLTEGTHTAVVVAIVDGAIDISVRSSYTNLNVGEFVQSAFGGGGGRPGAGRVRIPTPLFQNIPENLSTELFDACFKIVKHKALQIAGDKK